MVEARAPKPAFGLFFFLLSKRANLTLVCEKHKSTSNDEKDNLKIYDARLFPNSIFSQVLWPPLLLIVVGGV